MHNVDVTIFRAINNLAGASGGLDALGVFAAEFILPIMGILLILAAFTIRRFKEEHWYEMPVRAVASAAIAFVSRLIIGVIVGRTRPFVGLADVEQLIPMPHSYYYNSFPSAHASITFALAFFILRHDRDWGIAFLILAVLTALGRVFVGVHYPLDVLGGAILGWFAAWLMHKIESNHWGKHERQLRPR